MGDRTANTVIVILLIWDAERVGGLQAPKMRNQPRLHSKLHSPLTTVHSPCQDRCEEGVRELQAPKMRNQPRLHSKLHSPLTTVHSPCQDRWEEGVGGLQAPKMRNQPRLHSKLYSVLTTFTLSKQPWKISQTFIEEINCTCIFAKWCILFISLQVTTEM